MGFSRRAMLGGAVAVLGAGLGGALGLPYADPYRPDSPLPEGRLEARATTVEFGRHRLEVASGRWEIVDDTGRVVWRRDGAPIAAGHQQVQWDDQYGHLTFRTTRAVWPHVDVQAVHSGRRSVEITGSVGSAAFTLHLTSGDVLTVALEVAGADVVTLRTDLAPSEGLFGLGAQTLTDLRGHEVPILSREQGVGRGRQPLTPLAEFDSGAGGSATTTYTAISRAMTPERSFSLTGHEVSVWDARRGLAITSWSDHCELRIGPPSFAPPEAADGVAWNLPGAIVSAQGGAKDVDRKLGRLLDAGARVSAVWPQDWPGQRTTGFGDRVWWLWQNDEERYPTSWARGLQDRGLQLFLYANPFLVDASERDGWTGDNLFAEAVDAGYVVRDTTGAPLMLDQNGFDAAMVDLSDPEAGRWFHRRLTDEYARLGATGGMADFAEGPPFDAVLAGGPASALHNAWPVLWTRYQPGGWSFQRAAGSPGRFGDERPVMMWAGDQLTTWDEHDGMASAIAIILNAGVSGQPLMHADIGGYTGLRQPVVGVRRDRELLLRWAEWSLFSPAFRTHEGNQPDRFAQVWDDDIVEVFAHLTRLFAALEDYRGAVIAEALEEGTPAMRPVWWSFPGTWAASTAGRAASYLFGDFFVAPVLRPGAQRVRVVLPPGRWRHVWSDQEYRGDRLVEIEAPLGAPAVFHPAGDDATGAAAEALRTASDG